MKSLLVVLLLVTACHKPEGDPKAAQAKPAQGTVAQKKPRVRLQPVETKKITYSIEASGTIEPSEEISIPARVAGVVDDAPFTEGDRVTGKTVLVQIDLARYELAEKRAQADYDRAAAQKGLAEKLYQNRLNLYEEGRKRQKDWMSQEQLDIALADRQKADADLKAAEVELDLAKRNLADATIRSPIAGVIQKKLVSRGEYVKPETIVATILNVSPLYVRFTVPELEASRLKAGQPIKFRIQSVPGEDFTAELFYMSQKAEETTRAVECKARVDDPTSRLRPGYFASVWTVTEERNGLVIPERAVLSTKEGFIVFVADDHNKVAAKKVTLGMRVNGEVEILTGFEDLKPYHRAVVDGASALKDGMDVEPVADEMKN